MKKFFNIFFVTLGVIFSLLIVVGIYFYITDPYNLRPLISSFVAPNSNTSTPETGTVDKHPLLSAEQERALENIGINPAQLPTQITAEQEACFVEVLGAERVQEIKAGSTPTSAELMRASPCWR